MFTAKLEKLKNKKEPKGLPRYKYHASNERIYGYTQMFREDLTQTILPMGGSSRNYPNFQINISGGNSDINPVKNLLNSLTDGQYHKSAGLVSDAVQKIAHSLSIKGSAIYEIYFSNDDNPTLLELPGDLLVRLPGIYLQRLPKKIQDGVEVSRTFFRDYEIFEISMPSTLGGKRGYKKLISVLNSINFGPPDFHLDHMIRREQKKKFNLDRYSELTKLGVDSATKAWGWDRRAWTSDSPFLTAYYLLYRQIKFAWSKAVLRDHIISELNSLFGKIGYKVTISIEGIPSPDDILELQKRLKEGELPFEEVISKISLV